MYNIIYVLFAQGPAVLSNPISLSNFQRWLLKFTYDMEHPLALLSCKYVMKYSETFRRLACVVACTVMPTFELKARRTDYVMRPQSL